MATSQKCDLGVVLHIFIQMLAKYSSDAGVWQHYARISQHAALQLVEGTVTEQNLSHQHLTHNQKRHPYTLHSTWLKTPRACQDYTNNNSGDWQCAGQAFVEITSGLNGAQHQSVCTFWKATRIFQVLKKNKDSVTESYWISTLTSNTMSVISTFILKFINLTNSENQLSF